MNTKDKDWIELLAGRDSDEFTETEKVFFKKVRKELKKDRSASFTYCNEELNKERDILLQEWDKQTKSKPKQYFKNFVIPFAMAAGVAAISITVLLQNNDPYISKNVLASYDENNTKPALVQYIEQHPEKFDVQHISNTNVRDTVSSSILIRQTLELVHPKPKKINKKLIRFFTKNDIKYASIETKKGWDVDFYVSQEKFEEASDKLYKEGLDLKEYGLIKLIIKSK